MGIPALAPPVTSMIIMPPEITPPDDERRPSPADANVVDPEVLAERRAQRAEQAEQSAARRAADAQVLAAQLARERARLEAERDAARAEAAAAREGADAAIAEARHVQAERDTLRAELERTRAELVAEREAAAAARVAEPEPAAGPVAEPAPAERRVNGGARAGGGDTAPPVAWPAALRRELAVARTAAAVESQPVGAVVGPVPVPGLARERRLVARRAASGPVGGPPPLAAAEAARRRRDDRAAPITALALERERSSRLQAQLDGSLAVQRELRTHVAALQQAVRRRVEAERRIEAALRRVREELTAANLLAVQDAEASGAPPSAPVAPAPEARTGDAASGPPRAAAGTAAPSATPTPTPAAPRRAEPPAPAPVAPRGTEPPAPAPPAADVPEHAVATPVPPAEPPSAAAQPPTLALVSPVEQPPADVPPAGPARVAADAQPAPAPAGLDPERLAAARERLRAAAAAPALVPLPEGTPAPWLRAALQRLLTSDPATAGRLVVGLLPAQGCAARRPLRYDLLLSGRGCLTVDVAPGAATVAPRAAPRPRSERDLSIVGDATGLARLLHGRRSLRRPVRVRGGRRALRELRRLARAPLGLRDLAGSGVTLEPALALRLVALAIDPAATQGERFAIAHVPLAGGPVDAWLRIADGAPPEVCDRPPAEPTRLTLRCTRGALLPLLAGVEPPPGEAGTLDGDDAVLALVRSWIVQTEHPVA